MSAAPPAPTAKPASAKRPARRALRIGRLVIPTDAAGRIWLHYGRPQKSLYVSAADILSGKTDCARIADGIVLIGSSATGVSISDIKATPLARGVPGVEIHAQLLGQFLAGSYLVRPDWAKGAETLFTALFGTGLVLLVPMIGATLNTVAGGAAVAAASWFAFRDAQFLVDPVYPIAVLTILYLGASPLGHLRTEARQREIRRAFSRYMSPHYVEELARHPEKLVLDGETRVPAGRGASPGLRPLSPAHRAFSERTAADRLGGVFTAEEK